MDRATTEVGEHYHKLKRPDDFLAPTAGPAPRKNDTPPSRPAETAKRTLEEAGISDDEADEEPNKRSRLRNGPARFGRKGYRLQNTDIGMSSMFPGMLDEGDVSDDATSEALAYLRSVRTEASTIPNVLIAPRGSDHDKPDRSMLETGRGDYTVIYSEGTWIARDPTPEEYSQGDWSDQYEDLDPQEQYYRALLQRYQSMRKMLNDIHPTSPNPPDRPTCSNLRIATIMPTSRHQWLYTLDREYPSPSLLRKMSTLDVFMGLRFCTDSLDRFKAITKPKSCWIWALLARAPESGTLDYRASGCIRDLGHKAGQFGMRLRTDDGRVLRGDGGEQREKERGHGGGDEEAAVGEEEEGWEASEMDILEEPNGVPAPSMALQESTNGDTGNQHESTSQSDAEMSISEDEGEADEDPSAKLESARARLLAQVSGSEHLPQSEKPNPSPPGQKQAPVTSDDEPKTLEEARARLLEQLGDRLVKPQGTGRSNDDKPFASRADAERHRRGKDISEASRGMPHDSTKPTFVASEIEYAGPDLNTRATIDMILTVVAECYGQRDLLRFRELWE
ncbi:uncharacterized protein EI97DRAFT_460862 [Westerdykella ornata]|uniref:Uncharacterized protein n=1 Tax=Westerdykella ornata TaxID=318751 RepID=A0A6A6JBX5_WESOR|nr:uncharacterized protein EI97DRAFT_460862 [Westerdykella ornata]KAF2273673.1 hypothetical protein EI97DRAFT_460862 [Westerdykella ornata]